MGAGPSARGGHLLGSELMTLNGSHTGKRKGRHPKAAFLGVTRLLVHLKGRLPVRALCPAGRELAAF